MSDLMTAQNFYFLIVMCSPVTERVTFYIDDNKKRNVMRYDAFEKYLESTGYGDMISDVKQVLMTASNYLFNMVDKKISLLSAYENDYLMSKAEELTKLKNAFFIRKNELNNMNDRFTGFNIDLGVDDETQTVDHTKLNLNKKKKI
jgi:hypothetical protein